MNIEQKIIKMKKELEQVRNKVIQLQTEKDIKLKEMQKSGAKTPTEARQLLDKWKTKRAKIQKQIQSKLDEIEETYGEIL